MPEPIVPAADQPNNGQPPAADPPKADALPADAPPADAPKGDAPKDDAPVGAPEKYEFKAPEGSELDTKFVEVYSETAKELNLSQDNAQKLLDKVGPVIQQQQLARIEAVRNEWSEASKADTEFGGEKLGENLGVAKQALDKFGTPELKTLLNDSGLGNHPELVRFFYRAGKALVPDTFVGGRKEGKGASKTFNDIASRMYPDNK